MAKYRRRENQFPNWDGVLRAKVVRLADVIRLVDCEEEFRRGEWFLTAECGEVVCRNYNTGESFPVPGLPTDQRPPSPVGYHDMPVGA